jgi:hypothetical protein
VSFGSRCRSVELREVRLLGAVSGFSRLLVVVCQGRQRRDAAAAGEEQLGRCTAGHRKYYRLYLNKWERNPRRDVPLAGSRRWPWTRGGRTIAGAFQTFLCRLRLQPETSAWASGGPTGGAGEWRHAWGDGAHSPMYFKNYISIGLSVRCVRCSYSVRAEYCKELRTSSFMMGVKAPPETRRSRPSLSDGPSLCAAPFHC